MRNTLILTCTVLLVTALALGFAGCPRQQGKTGNSRLIALFTADSTPMKTVAEGLFGDKLGPVSAGAILSLVVSVDEIRLVREGAREDEVEVIFAGPFDVDLMNLLGVSAVLSESEVPSGTYKRIVLHISNPRLVLQEAPDTELVDVQLTANGRLFTNATFTLPPDQTSLVLLDFSGIHLVEQGNGGFTLTPQLRADVTVTDAAVAFDGVIVAVDTSLDLLVVQLPEGEIEVGYAAASIYMGLDEQTPSGTEAALAVSAAVRVEGIIHVDGSVSAQAIYVLQ